MEPVVVLLLVVGACLAVPVSLAVVLLARRTKESPDTSPATPFEPVTLARLLDARIEGSDDDAVLRGESSGRAWAVRVSQTEGVWGALVEVECTCPADVRLRPEGFFGGKDPIVGDPTFDSAFELRGDPAWLSAALSTRARTDLLDLQASGGYRVQQDRVVASVSLDSTGTSLRKTLDTAVRLAEALSISADEVPELLARRAREGAAPRQSEEPVDGAWSGVRGPQRLAALRLLARFPGSRHSRALVEDPPPWLAGDPEFEAMSPVVTRPMEAEVSVLPLLASPEVEIRRAAATWLRGHGTAASVQPLREAAVSQLREEILSAVAAIRSRCSDVAAGGLALVDEEPEAGRLALADEQEGRLALEREGGRRRRAGG